MTIDISDLDPADVLAALYNASRPQGMGFLHYDPQPMTRDEAAALLRESDYFDYLKGRVMKVEIANPLDARLYDRDNGDGAAERAIAALRAGDTTALQVQHEAGKQAAAREIKAELDTPTTISEAPGVFEMRLGVSDVAEPLNKAIDQALGQPASEPQSSGDAA